MNIFFEPTYFLKKSLRDTVAELMPRGRVLDVGCGAQPYKSHCDEYVGMEHKSADGNRFKADITYDGNSFPIEDASFDAVLSSEVLEHVFNPDEHLSEIHRVLKEDGMLLLTTPLMWKEHQVPHDYGRYSSYGLKFLLERHGFDIVEQRKLVTGIPAILVLLQRYLREIKWYRYICFPLNALIFLAKFIPDDKTYYLDNVVLVRKI